MALADPELDDGAEEDGWIVADDELPVPEDELAADPVDDDPEVDVPDLAADDALAALCAELGRVKASPPATARPSTPAPGGRGAEPAAGPLTPHHGRHCAGVAAVHHDSFSESLHPLLFRNDLWLSFPVHLRRL